MERRSQLEDLERNWPYSGKTEELENAVNRIRSYTILKAYSRTAQFEVDREDAQREVFSTCDILLSWEDRQINPVSNGCHPPFFCFLTFRRRVDCGPSGAVEPLNQVKFR